MSIADNLATVAENQQKVFDAGKKSACPDFNYSGAAVVCCPLEGSLLTVETEDGATKVYRQGRNLIPYPYKDTTKTVNGVTFTVNDDRTITVNGTATANAQFVLYNGSLGVPFPENMGASIIGTPAGGSSSTYHMENAWCGVYDNGNGVYLASTVSSSIKTYWCSHLQIVIKSGYTADNLVFKPCLRVGRGGEYEPYVARETFAPGEAIPVLPGVNTIYADNKGIVTVTGIADPVETIDWLTDTLNTFGCNI